MKTNVKGSVLPATVVEGTGFAEVWTVLQAYGIPLRLNEQGGLLLGLRRFAEVLGQPCQYNAADDTFYIAAAPLPVLPCEPVGAGVDPWQPVTAPIRSGPDDRRPDLLELVIRQFGVASNPRHVPRNGNTYCNIFLWDVTLALGCEIPHWVGPNGAPVPPGRGRELDANGVIEWLRNSSRSADPWHHTGAAGAGAAANAGCPAVASWYNPGGIGHVAIVRPGKEDPRRGVPIAQAGGTNFDEGYLADGFGAGRITAVEYYVHD